MRKRTFTSPTETEIQERKKMYEEADEIGIDLMGFDAQKSYEERKDIRKAVVLLGTGKKIPKVLKDRIKKRQALT